VIYILKHNTLKSGEMYQWRIQRGIRWFEPVCPFNYFKNVKKKTFILP
jgi:hypothetical protein